MFKKITNAISAFALSLALASPMYAKLPPERKTTETDTVSTVEDSSEKITVTPFVGFNYRTLAVGDELEEYLDETRNRFDPAMPGFAAFLQVGKQLPTLNVGVDIGIPVRLLPRDTLELRIGADFSSSAIFGESLDEEIFPAHVKGADLGDTPTSWKQHLNFYFAFAAGASYSPISWASDTIKPYVEVTTGVSYIDSTSVLHIHMNGSDFTRFMIDKGGVELLNSLDIYTDILGEAKTTGVGYFVSPAVGFAFDIKGFMIKVAAGYRIEFIPIMTIKEHTVSDSKVEDKSKEIIYDASGLDARLILGYEF